MNVAKTASFPKRAPERKFQGQTNGVFISGLRGFSLLEMLSVIAIVAILMTLLLPAIASMSGTAGRRGAVNIVMNTIDQARVAALEQGRDVHVVFARRNAPEPDAIMVVRNDATNAPTEKLTRWIPLPKGVIFSKQGVFEDQNPPVSQTQLSQLGSTGSISEIGVLTFGPSGTVQYPRGNDNKRRVHLSEGVRQGNSDTWRTAGLDIISVARYTGRPQLDVTF